MPMRLECSKIYVTECEGEVVLIRTCEDCIHFSIFKLDNEKMGWVETQSLKNRAIFLNNDRLSSSFAIYTQRRAQKQDFLFWW